MHTIDKLAINLTVSSESLLSILRCLSVNCLTCIVCVDILYCLLCVIIRSCSIGAALDFLSVLQLVRQMRVDGER